MGTTPLYNAIEFVSPPLIYSFLTDGANESMTYVFCFVFALFWLGSMVITINAKLLGAKM
jgi:hypothetical protein